MSLATQVRPFSSTPVLQRTPSDLFPAAGLATAAERRGSPASAGATLLFGMWAPWQRRAERVVGNLGYAAGLFALALCSANGYYYA